MAEIAAGDQSPLTLRLARGGPRKLLALDGGGIRGVLSLEILAEMERLLIKQSGRPDYRLADYFDYISGTSTGGIIAAGLSLGMSVADIMKFYVDNGAAMFERVGWFSRALSLGRSTFKHGPLAQKLKDVFGEDTKLGSPRLRSLLLLVMRNANTDSPWPISNNPCAKYNDASRNDDNLKLPLWQLVRASTAAPTYFDPEEIDTGGKKFYFVDGGVTMYNNPAFQMFLMATVSQYWPRALPGISPWETGLDKMLIMSVGTGTSAGENFSLTPKQMTLLFNAKNLPSALMYAALNEQDTLCRVFGDCVEGPLLDREIGALMPSRGPLDQGAKLFRYARYNAELTPEGLQALGCGGIDPKKVQQLDSVDSIGDLRKIGKAVAAQRVKAEHFEFGTFKP